MSDTVIVESVEAAKPLTGRTIKAVKVVPRCSHTRAHTHKRRCPFCPVPFLMREGGREPRCNVFLISQASSHASSQESFQIQEAIKGKKGHRPFPVRIFSANKRSQAQPLSIST